MSCPAIDHLACKLPGDLEPRTYDLYVTIAPTAGQFLPQQFVDIGNRDAPWHLAAVGWAQVEGTGTPRIKVYNSRGFAISQSRLVIGNQFGGANAALPVFPSLVWPVNSSLMFDFENTGVATGNFGLYFFGFKIFDRGKAPC